ncbi:tryptophan synthase subunit alpha [Flavobacterium sp. Sd200]|uniref:tryptophan synthase subunit alpha n=1 Tax=Flavobacterium sp. Sd200 TaxID=2692211 RepID=UPI00136B8020|nr:tryptophan synthase subunit alpha [Flavobacterium sp. Sd200]MXN89962.1 tryptophan synthase subunit alpha [Flavobacterium sp. Sd200]
MNPFIKDTKQVSIFVTAGYPKLDSLKEQLLQLQEQGVDFIEVGIPFSDPMADGPVIQQTSTIALQNGMKLGLLLDQLDEIKTQVHIPLVLMGYLNPVLQFGLDAFLERCKKLNIASLILPDLSVELYETKYKDVFEKYGIPVTFLVTPLTPDARVERIAQVCKNSFVYLVGQNSITGQGYSISNDLAARYTQLKKLCGAIPLFLGFGIDSKEKKEKAFTSVDGVIVGTAYLKAVKAGDEDFVKELLG